jgi:hypothetical protein
LTLVQLRIVLRRGSWEPRPEPCDTRGQVVERSSHDDDARRGRVSAPGGGRTRLNQLVADRALHRLVGDARGLQQTSGDITRFLNFISKLLSPYLGG